MFIAEISSNHNRDINRCIEFINKSKEIGFDAVKFQLFQIDKLFSNEILDKSKIHRDRSKWELPYEYIKILSKECKKLKIKFGVTPFYLEAVDKIEKYIDFYKIASYELLWLDLIKKCSQKNLPIILSTGMANLKEIDDAVKILKKNKSNFSLLHCVSQYPAADKDLNLSVIKNLKKLYNVKIGWSDHSNSKDVVLSACLKWQAEIIEMHLDLDKKGFEYKKNGHCWLPNEAKEVIHICKNSKNFDGNGIKKHAKSEKDERMWRADPIDGLRPLRRIRKKF